jgi:putative transcriptional regulator
MFRLFFHEATRDIAFLKFKPKFSEITFDMSKELLAFPKPGNLLLSDPFLKDENFGRSVVLLCEHQETGSFGLVINKPSILCLGDLVEELSFFDASVYVGGPVEQNTLHFIYCGRKMLIDSTCLGPELWWGGDFRMLVQLLKVGDLLPNQVRFFMGYSGWESGQLYAELQEKTWIVYTGLVEQQLFEKSAKEIWKALMKDMGGDFTVQANYPLDPRLN